MGVWGVDIFENDFALDYIDDFSVDSLDDILDTVLKSQYIDASLAMEALAAICVVASCKSDYCRDKVKDKIENFDLDSTKLEILTKKAEEAIKRIVDKSSSELYELWEDSDEFILWSENMKKIQNEVSS